MQFIHGMQRCALEGGLYITFAANRTFVQWTPHACGGCVLVHTLNHYYAAGCSFWERDALTQHPGNNDCACLRRPNRRLHWHYVQHLRPN
jgi:hypothetical protein